MLKTFIARKSVASVLATAIVLGAGAFVPTSVLNAAPQAAAPDNALVMSVGASRVVNLSAQMSDVVVANPDVADVGVRSQNQIYIIGKKPGETTIFVTAKNGKVLYSGTVRVGNNLTSVDQMLKMAMPEADINVATMNGMVLLTGTIRAPEDAAEAERLTQAFVGKDVTVVSRLRTATPLQVTLQVRIAEVSRNLLYQVGMNLASADLTSGFKFGVGSGRNIINEQWSVGGPLGTGNGIKPLVDGVTGKVIGSGVQSIAAGATFAADTHLLGLNLLTALDLAETSGLATMLAQPNLTALSGETASFLAGGEYPYAVSNGLQGNTIEYKQYGVQLAFTPTVLSDGRISMRVRPTVSSLDFSINANVPALKSRSVETSVEMGSGQSYMIAGLLNSDTGNNVDKVPFLGNIPVLGNLFKSRKFQRNETELVVIVTPYLVKPMNPGEVMLPTDGFRNATKLQGLLQQGSDGKNKRDPEPTLAPGAPTVSGSGRSDKSKGKSASPNKPTKSDAAPGFSF